MYTLFFLQGLGNYAFGYNEDHATGGTFFKEKGAPGVKIGSYGLRDADGRMRVVSLNLEFRNFNPKVSCKIVIIFGIILR